MFIQEILEANKYQIIEDYKNGQSTVKLGKRYGCNGGTIWIFLQKHQVELRKAKSVKKDYPTEVIKQLLLDNISIYFICKHFNVHERIVSRIAKEIGIDTSKKSKTRKDRLKNHEQEIIQMYENGISGSNIAKEFKSAESSVGRILNKNSVKIRTKDYQVNENFFEKIDTEQKAYILGFITADGCNETKKLQIRVTDLEILEKIKIAMEYNGPIILSNRNNKKDHWKDIYNLCVSKKKICNDLSNLDCPPNKTFTTKFPIEEKVPSYLIKHYIRGLMDGDGSIYQTHQRNAWHVSIAGTYELLNGLCEFITKELGFTPHLYEHGNIYQIRMNCSFAKKFLTYIYTDSTIYLQRKYDLYRKMCIEL